MGMSIDSYWNEEDDTEIICPYCREKYTPTYDETIIGDECVNCYAEGEVQTVTCDSCGKKFTIEPYQSGWKYRTETIDGEMTEQEHEEDWE
jgi:uncharacterized Zn-finger protein